MKKQYGKMVVPVMLGVLCAAPAFAQEDPPTEGPSITKSYTEEVGVTLQDHVRTELVRTNTNSSALTLAGAVTVFGEINVESYISALIDDKQMNHDNCAVNYLHTNTAKAGDNVLESATGNIGLSIVAGDNNMQDNSAALAAADADFVFDAADATVVVNQDTVANSVFNHGSTNTASLGGSSLANASGNIGVNIAAGNSNLQKNNFAATAGAADVGTAAVTVMQQAEGNRTVNAGHYDMLVDVIDVSVGGTLNQSNSPGNPASITGSYSGTSDQYGNVYLDTWDSPLHAAGTQDHHIDLDSYVQALLPDPNNPYVDDPANSTALAPADLDPNGDGGGLLFNDEGTIGGELNNLQLSGTLSGQIVDVTWVAAPTVNTASLGANVLQGASGNIGLNVAAGTNNLQSNSLAMIANFTAPTPPNGGGEL